MRERAINEKNQALVNSKVATDKMQELLRRIDNLEKDKARAM